nr:ankyrin repeat [Pandoravirus massiliensis]
MDHKNNKNNNRDGGRDAEVVDIAPSGDLPVPNEILATILGYVDNVDAVAAGCVNRNWRALSAPSRVCRRGYTNRDYMAALARRGHLGVLRWARAGGCPWDARTCAGAAKGGHLEVLQWARQRMPLGRAHVRLCGQGRASKSVAVGARQRVSMGWVDMSQRGQRRAPRGAAVGSRQRVPVE